MWLKLKKLGSGSYGKVYFAVDYDNLIKVVVKTALVEKARSLEREALILKKLKGNPYVVQCYGEDVSFDEEENGYVYNLLMEYAARGSLKDMIAGYGVVIPEEHVAYYAYMLLKGLSFVHGKGIVHCDIKPDNVLVFPTKNRWLSHLKLADFGLSKLVAEDVKGTRGTAIYASPESLSSPGIQGAAADIWSFGCTVLDMLSRGGGIRVFDYNKMKREMDDNVSETAKDFLNNCFRHMDSRWTADQLLNHPFIKNINRRMFAPPGLELNQLVDYQINPLASQWRATTGNFYPRTISATLNPAYNQCLHQPQLHKRLAYSININPYDSSGGATKGNSYPGTTSVTPKPMMHNQRYHQVIPEKELRLAIQGEEDLCLEVCLDLQVQRTLILAF